MIERTDCILVMGRRGCGKSYLAKRVQEIFPRRVIVDTLREYSDPNKYFIVQSFEGFSKKLIEFKENNVQKFALVYQFPVEGDLYEHEFNEIMRVCYYFSDIQIVIEEVQQHSHAHYLPGWLRKNLLIGRHQNLSLLFTSQRPGEVHKTIVSQCAHIFCGQIVEGNDLNYVANFLNEDAYKLSKLPKRQFLYFHDGVIQQISNDF